jgi:hypothetical protein
MAKNLFAIPGPWLHSQTCAMASENPQKQSSAKDLADILSTNV